MNTITLMKNMLYVDREKIVKEDDQFTLYEFVGNFELFDWFNRHNTYDTLEEALTVAKTLSEHKATKCYPVVAWKSDEDMTYTLHYTGDCAIDYLAQTLDDHEGMEFQFLSTLELFHGADFVDKFNLEIKNNSTIYRMPIAVTASSQFREYCEKNFPYE